MFDRFKKAVKAAHRATANAIGTVNGTDACCCRCSDKFNWKVPHFTVYSPGLACCPLCEECWKMLNPIERLPFYYQFVDRTFATGDYASVRDAVLLQIRKAVQEGK